ncbi:MAG TPA: thioredoxin domain-containing protein [Candidatus Nanopelagicaceae bacterium]
MANKSNKSGGDKITRYIVIGMVVFVVAVGVIFSFVSNKSSNTAAVPSSVSKADGYGIVFNGDLTGKPVVDLWEDFQCPVCAHFEATDGAYMQQLILSKKAKVVYHLLSFIGPESILAANAGACAADQGKFLQFHSFLYSHQGTENTGTWSNAALIVAGAAVGITDTKFATCVNTGKYNGWVTNISNDGATKNINQTPTLLVNGKEISRGTNVSSAYFDPALLKKAIEG